MATADRDRTRLCRAKAAMDWASAHYGDPLAAPPAPLASLAGRRLDEDFVAFLTLYTAVECLLRGENADDLLDDLDLRRAQRRFGLPRQPGGEGPRRGSAAGAAAGRSPGWPGSPRTAGLN